MLVAQKVCASYGSVQVLNGVDFELKNNEILSLVGRNGVGKTTLMRVLIGLLKSTSGKIDLDGKCISNLPPYTISRSGIAYVPQGRGIFPKLTVRENLQIGTRSQISQPASIPQEIYTYFPILKERFSQYGGTLSGGQQQMLSIARALCGMPKILLLDEPSEGIQPSIVQQLGDIIIQIVKDTDISVLLVEQNLDIALHTAQRVVAMEKGKIVHEDTPESFRDVGLQKKFLAL